jgi:hypothetical protein
MTKFFAGVLSVIAVGVLLIAYGLLNPQTSAYAGYYGDDALRRALPGGAEAAYVDAPRASYVEAPPRVSYVEAPPRVSYVEAPVRSSEPLRVRTVETQPAPQVVVVDTPAARAPAPRVEPRERKRDWRKTALVIGGSTASGAGVGAIFGGKKGALIGAAIGGGASTIYESTR